MAVYSLGRRRVIILLVLSSMLLITLDIRGNAAIDKARSAFGVLLSPFDTAARTISRPVVNAWEAISNYDDLQRDNERLRQENLAAKGAEIEARASILEYSDLRALNRLPSAGNYKSVTAEVLGLSPSNFSSTIEIDKGSSDGIATGMPVLSAAGMVGKITSVTPSTSLVLLVTDPRFHIGVKVLSQGNAPLTDDGGLATQNTRLDQNGDPVVFEEDNTTTSSSSSTSTSTTTTVPTGPTTTVVDENGNPFTPTVTTVEAVTTTSSVPQIEVVKETGTLSGQGPNKSPTIGEVDGARLVMGATVQTSGGKESIAPAGLPIGTVAAIRSQSGSSTKIVDVDVSSGDLSRLNFLTVLLYLPNMDS